MPDAVPALLNINASYGSGAYAAPPFRTPRDVLAHMDYLQVQRAVVYHAEARDVNPTWGNRKLLAQLDADPELAERLIPALVLTPVTVFEDGGMEHIRAVLGSGRTRACRIFPATSGFGLGQLERVVSEIAEYRPVIFWDFRNTTGPQDARDLAAIAARYPTVSFVCTELMWQQFGAVLDLMWRCSNICIDTSWLHMRHALELLVERFGAERVLFGMGPRAHYGAAVGALMHAQIPASARTQIGARNAERLLGLDSSPLAMAEPPLLQEKPLWVRHRQGLPIEGVRIIDAHGHTAPHTRGWYLPDTDVEQSLKGLVDQMDRLGIERTIVAPEPALFGDAFAGGLECEAWLARYRDRISGYLVYNPVYAAQLLPELDGFFDRGVYVGFKILPSYWRIDVTDPAFEPVWDCAHRRRLPVLIHAWQGAYNAPEKLTDIAARYPEARLLLGHSGGGDEGRRQAEALAGKARHVYLEFCGSFLSNIPWHETLERVGPQQTVFGSDTVAHDQAWELARYLSAPVPDACLVPGLAATMDGILQAVVRHSDATERGAR